MPNPSGQTTSVWMTTADVPSFPPLAADERADVCVVGGGIAGLTTAYLLAKEGKAVVVLEAFAIGGGQTGLTTAHLASEQDDRVFEIERLHGEEGTRRAVASHAAAIDLVGEISRAEGIDCDFERLDAYLFCPPDQSRDVLDKELDACRRAGMQVEKVARAPIADFDTGPALRFADQGQFHPLKYLAGLARAITKLGGRIYCETRVERVDGGEPATIQANGHTVTADAVVVATCTPINDRYAIHTKIAPYRSYVVGLRVPAGAVTKALYWDTPDPYHYVRLQRLGAADEVLIVGGEDHKTGQDDDAEARYARLEAWARARWPMAGEVAYRWSGQVFEPVDALGYIGRNPGDAANVFIATGDSGQGTTHGTIAGMLLKDLILGRENPWATLYDPARKALQPRAAWEFAKENLDVAAQYADWVTGGDVASEDQIGPGTGAIVRSGLKKWAVYRDESGTLHRMSAACTHLGCVVRWNSGEKSWDCPCHGSRFGPTGEAITGPAVRPLDPVEGG